MAEVEYVPKREVKEYRKVMMDALVETLNALKKNGKLMFQVALVGSAKRNLVLRKGGSDYDVDIQLNLSSENISPNYREDILEELKKHLSAEWTFDQSTSVITARIPNKKSFDLALINMYYDVKLISILDKQDEVSEYIWNEVPNSQNHRERLRTIYGSEDWTNVRDEYKKLKSNQWDESEDMKKPSYALYAEAINNVCNNKE